MRICVIVPAHNEEVHVGDIVGQVRRQGIDVIVIDDGSADKTSEIARARGAQVLRNPARQGKGFSLKRGFAYALEKGYQGVVCMDGDGQHSPDDLPLFLRAARADALCIVNGTRLRDTKNMPLIRKITNRFMSFVISRVCGRQIEDTQCGYRYISSDVLRRLDLKRNDFEIETEILLQSAKLGCEMGTVPVQTIYRDEKSKINPLKDTIRFCSYLYGELRKPKVISR